jgi:hypothetical protein
MLFEQLVPIFHVLADIAVIPAIVLLYKIKLDLAALELRIAEKYVKKEYLKDYVKLYSRTSHLVRSDRVAS